MLVLVSPPRGTPADAPCEDCCPWALPIAADRMRRGLPHNVSLLFEEWLLWHLHAVQHQGLGRRDGRLD